jgi:spore maturation protein CgeB
VRIFYAAPSQPHETLLPSSRIWYWNLFVPLGDLGHELVPFEYDFDPINAHLDPRVPDHKAFQDANRPRFAEELLRQVRAAHAKKPIELFFSYFTDAYVAPGAIEEIKALGIPTVNWYCNASYQLRFVERLAPVYDWCLVPERFRLEDYRRLGARPVYCQMAANPALYKPYDVPHEFDVTFVGQKYGTRPAHLKALVDAGLDARAWGPRWRDRKPLWRVVGGKVKRRLLGRPEPPAPAEIPLARCGPPLSDEDLIRMYSRSRISLGFSVVDQPPQPGQEPILQVRLRDFEAPMSGAFYLVERFDELGEFYEPGKEIVMFEGEGDLVEKARWYLAHPDERERIRAAGLARARAEHTWHKRFEAAFREMGLR